MGKVKAKKKSKTIKFHRYIIHDLEVTDKQGNTSIGTYLLYSCNPLNLPELSKLKKDEKTTLDGKTLTEKLLSNEIALRAIRWVDPNVFKSIGADLKKAVMFEGKIIDEIPVSMSNQMRILNTALKTSGPGGITITYEGTVNKPEKNYISKLDTVPTKAKHNEFMEKRVA